MDKDEILIKKRFIDLSKMSYQKGISLFTDFLSMNELSILHNTKSSELSAAYCTFGGYEFAERQMAMFVPDALFYDMPYPITVLQIMAKYPKFAQELSHRDYLGAVIHLGVDRCKIGDIVVREKEAYIFCHEKMAQFFCDELTQIKHTAVDTVVCDVPKEISKPDFAELTGTVSSLRADSIAALALHRSRSSIQDLFKMQKIFVNGKIIESGSYIMKEEDILTVRGFGRFIFKEVINITKKDRLHILILQFK